MNYTKNTPSGTAPTKNKDEDTHRPELCLSEPHTPEVTARREHFALPTSFLLGGVAVLCMLSFLAGCSVTDRTLCRVMLAIGCASHGRVPAFFLSDSSTEANRESTSSAEEPTYRKYKQSTAPTVSDGDALAYLNAVSAENSEYIASPEASDPDRAVTASLYENGAIHTDSETMLPVVGRDLRADNPTSLSNETDYAPDVSALLERTPPALRDLTLSDEPLVLILHTHGTEGYNECAEPDHYDAASTARNEDIRRNVVSVGEALSEVLNDFGIVTLHDTEMCDRDSFVRAYKTSAARAEEYLKKYPSLRFVIDLHRDAIVSSDGTSTAPRFEHDGSDTAQLMLVVGTDAAGADHPHWEDNLSLALHIQKALSEDCPGLLRRINLRTASFNQQRSSGYLLLECGASANRREEAVRAARLFATGFARMLYSAGQSRDG